MPPSGREEERTNRCQLESHDDVESALTATADAKAQISPVELDTVIVVTLVSAVKHVSGWNV